MLVTVTSRSPPVAEAACMPGSNTEAPAMSITDSPTDLADKVTTNTVPEPDTPPELGGRVPVICNVPFAVSARYTSATGCRS